jgi:hypothetical protein
MLLSQLLASVPHFAIFLVAGVLAVARWDRHPTTSLLVVTAAAIAVVARVAGLAVPMLLRSSDVDATNTMWIVYGVTGLVSNVGLGCLVAAAFVERSTKSGPPPQFR